MVERKGDIPDENFGQVTDLPPDPAPQSTKVVAIQRNFDGQGNDRRHTRWVKPDQVDLTVQRMSRAYNLDHTDITIEH